MSIAAVETRPPQTVAPSFATPAAVRELTGELLDLWRDTPDSPPRLGPPVSWLRRWRNYRAARRLVDWLFRQVEGYPESEGERAAWRERVRARIQGFGEERLGWPASYSGLVCGEEYFAATVDFVREARSFDPEARPEELGQALRNVWIANSLQMLLDLPVRVTPSIFGYSMLYPYTDNLLDDPDLGVDEKREFNRRLGLRLGGLSLAAASAREDRVFKLVGRIEGQYPRRRFPGVYESLLAIHRAQVASLRQQRRPLPEPELLALSFEKGGASVLADGYLVAGELDREAARFCFGYGVFLQLLDDLQDARGDLEAGHWTVFSRATERRLSRLGPLAGHSGERCGLERSTGRLHRFMERVLERPGRFSEPRHRLIKDLIRRNCTFLLTGAIAESRGLFGRAFRRLLESRWPFGLTAQRRLRRCIQKRQHRTARTLEHRRGVTSLLDLLD